MFCKKAFLKIFSEIPVRRSLSNNVKSFHGVRLATLLKKDSLTGVSDQAVCWTEYGEIQSIESNCGKYGPGKTLYLETFHAEFCIIIYSFDCQFSLNY